MNATLRLTLLATVGVIQIAASAWMIVETEITLRYGETYNFSVAPVDPSDPFRGRYVAIRLMTPSVSIPATEDTLSYNSRVYARLGKDAQGLAIVTEVSRQPFTEGDYMAGALSWAPSEPVPNIAPAEQYMVQFHLDRFYMPEALAPEAEQAYRNTASRWGEENDRGRAVAVVKIRNGKGFIEDILLDGAPITDVVKAGRPTT